MQTLEQSAAALHDSVYDAQRYTGARPLRTLIIHTSMPVGGAEMLTLNLIRRLDRERIIPELCCLKEPGPLGEILRQEVPLHDQLLCGKYDVRVWPRLTKLLGERKIDALITVGAGDKMFWGRLAGYCASVPVVLSALHSTGWPDGISRLNRRLTPITDGFIAVAPSHGRFLIEQERLPAGKVHVITNGVDTDRFAPVPDSAEIRAELDIRPTDPVVSIVAALRPEKNHELFLEMAWRVLREEPAARFLIIGDGPCRASLMRSAAERGIDANVHFLGSRLDVPRLLSASDVFALTSHNEASPVSILEAMSVGCPVVATDVGSIAEAVVPGKTGYLTPAGDAVQLTGRVLELLRDPLRARSFGRAGREKVLAHHSLEVTVRGYETLIEKVYARKARPRD